MFKFLLIPAAALALTAGSAVAAPSSVINATGASTAPAAADWGIAKQKVGYKRRKFRGHRFGQRRFRGHRFGHRRFYVPRFGYYGHQRGYRGGYGYGYRPYGFGVRGPGTNR